MTLTAYTAHTAHEPTSPTTGNNPVTDPADVERNRFRGHRLSGEFVNVPIA
jgi:hypothetical protein